jgi:Zn-dependent protease with chaperone function
MNEMEYTTVYFDCEDIVVLPKHDELIEFTDFSPRERSKLSQLYTDNISSASISGASTGIFRIFITSGFFTAVSLTNIMFTIILGVLSVLAALSAPVYIIRNSVPLSEFSDTNPLHEAFKNAKENVGRPDAELYITPFSYGSPFTLPLGKKPRIYIPKDLVDQYTVKEHTAIFEHELGHHQYEIGKNFTYILDTLSVVLIAPVIVRYVSTNPMEVFLILALSSTVIHFVSIYLNTKAEYRSDTFISDPMSIITAFLKLSDEPIHSDSRFERVLHHLSDPHPPMNDRIKSVYGENAPEITVDKNTNLSAVSILLGIGVIVSGVIVGYGFLKYTPAGVSPQFILGGVLLYLGFNTLEASSGLNTVRDRVRVAAGVYGVPMLILSILGIAIGNTSIPQIIADGALVFMSGVFILGFVIGPIAIVLLALKSPTSIPNSLDYPATSWEESVEMSLE